MWDETARELCERFFRPLVEEKQADKRDYKRAFFAAIDAMRHPAHLPLLEDCVSTAEQEEHCVPNRRGSVETCIFLMGLFLIWAVPGLLTMIIKELQMLI